MKTIKMDIKTIINNSPVDLKDLSKLINKFRRNLNPKTKHLEVFEERLINARGELEKILSVLINTIKKEDIELHKKLADILYERFQFNFTGIMNIVDKEQDMMIVKIPSEKISIGNLTTFKVFLETMFFDLVELPLKKAYTIYQEKKDKEEFCYNLFMSLASILEIKGGLRREAGRGPLVKSKGLLYGGNFPPYETYKERADEIIDKEHQQTFGEDYSSLFKSGEEQDEP